MSAVRFVANTGEIATGTSAKTLLQLIAASNHRIIIKELSVSFKGTSNTAAPILVRLCVQTDAGTMSSLTLVKQGDWGETLEASAQHTATVEPTTTSVFLAEEVHPQTGFTWQAPHAGEIHVPGGTRVGVVVTAGADVNAIARMICEE